MPYYIGDPGLENYSFEGQTVFLGLKRAGEPGAVRRDSAAGKERLSFAAGRPGEF